jgi:hypothetical protein
MPDTHTHTRKLIAPAMALIVALLCLGLAACGGSSSTTTSTTANAANTSSTAHGATANGATANGGRGRFANIRACLQRNGITLPAPTPGAGGPRVPGGPGGPGFQGGGERKLPNGVTRAQLQAAMQKCGGGRTFTGQGQRFNSPAYRNALTAYATCMNNNGIKLPTANTSGHGPVFNTTGLNTNSAQFKAATAKCQSVLRSAFQSFRQARPGGATGGT